MSLPIQQTSHELATSNPLRTDRFVSGDCTKVTEISYHSKQEAGFIKVRENDQHPRGGVAMKLNNRTDVTKLINALQRLRDMMPKVPGGPADF